MGFTLAGAFIFAVYGLVGAQAAPTIRVSAEMIRGLVETREAVVGRPLDAPERDALIREYVDREILVREALARGLHERDGRVRSRLVDKMLFLIDEEPPEPSTADLEALHAADPGAFRSPAATSFEHVFFARDEPPDTAVLVSLRAGASAAEVEGDAFWLGSTLENVSAAEVGAVLGAAFATSLEAGDQGVWLDPMRSTRGWHVVRILERHPPQPLPPAILQRALRDAWLAQRRSLARERTLAELRADYRVEISAPGATSG